MLCVVFSSLTPSILGSLPLRSPTRDELHHDSGPVYRMLRSGRPEQGKRQCCHVSEIPVPPDRTDFFLNSFVFLNK